MKDINTYICEHTLDEPGEAMFIELLSNELNKHICIELYDEYGYTMYENAHMFEKLGSFENSGKIVMYIFEHIDWSNTKADMDCTELNTFFKRIHINISKKDIIEGEYYKTENDTVFLNLVVPSQIDPSKHYKPIMKILLHELLHAYEDSNRKGSIFDYFTNEYANSARFMKTAFLDINKKLFEFGYFYNDQERNAYFSNIYNDVNDVLHNLNMTKLEDFDYKKFIDKLKETDVWKTYFNIAKFIMSIDNMDESDKAHILDIFKFIKGKTMTFEQVKKELHKKLDKFNSKFNQLVPKCVCDIIEVSNKKIPAQEL